MADTDNSSSIAIGGGLWGSSELAPANSGLSITNQRAALTQGVNGIANDLGSQSDDTTTALQAIVNALNGKPSE
jgi:hypothetical protein